MRRPSARIGRREAVLLAVAPVIAFLVSGASRAGPPWQTANAHAVSRVRRQGGAVAGAAELVDAARFPAELTVPLDMMVPGAMPLVLARIPPGIVDLGSLTTERGREPNEAPVFRRYLPMTYYVAKYETTQAQWEFVMGSLPAGIPSDERGPNYPVRWLSHDMASAYVAGLNGMTQGWREGFSSLGFFDACFVLPSEAEWEHAARAGTTTRFSFGDSLGCDDLAGDCATGSDAYPGLRSDYMWFLANAELSTHLVGSKLPNVWGLCDVHGNVSEWAEDRYAGQYPMDAPLSARPWCDGDYAEEHPGWQPCDRTVCQGQASNDKRVIRSGSFFGPAMYNRSAKRDGVLRDQAISDAGFRVVLTSLWPTANRAEQVHVWRADLDEDALQDWLPDDPGRWGIVIHGAAPPTASRWGSLSEEGTLDTASPAASLVMSGDGADVGRHAHSTAAGWHEFTIQADVQKVQGDSREQAFGYGLYVDSDGSGATYYECIIVVDGFFKIGRSLDGAYETLVDWTSSPAIRTGYGVWNTLKASHAMGTLQFYANDRFLAAVEGPSLGGGRIGLFAIDAATSDAPDMVAFANVMAYGQAEAGGRYAVFLPHVARRLRFYFP